MSKSNLTVLGAGLVGSLLSIYLKRRGFEVDVYERRSDMRSGGNYGGRSINLALSDRGFAALEKVGIDNEIRKVGIPMHGRMIHNLDGSLSFQPYGKEGQSIYSVSRSGLNYKLMDLAEAEGVRIHFNLRCNDVDLQEKTLHFEHNETRQKLSLQYEQLFGTDGAFSALRSSMMKTDRFEYSQDYLPHGYKELTIPPTEDGSFAMEKNALHIWPRGHFMMIALPNPDGSFTCTLFFPYEGSPSFSEINTPADLMAFFETYFNDAIPLMPTLVEDYFANPTPSLVTTRCFPWKYADNAVLLGDAAHAIVPFYGQGMNAGFEDVRVFDELFEQIGDNWESLFDAFQHTRKPDGDAIATLAKNNFVEMRDKVADPQFILQKKIEARIHARYPDKWIPLYSMVTFSPKMRYSEALQKGQFQDQLMARLMANTDYSHRLESAELDAAIDELIREYQQ
jgi:kynurenine 3-monooxygenase